MTNDEATDILKRELAKYLASYPKLAPKVSAYISAHHNKTLAIGELCLKFNALDEQANLLFLGVKL